MSYAAAWSKWFDVIEGGAAPFSATMFELANLDQAKDVLDVGTGVGEPAVSAARSLPEGGRVTAIDRDPKMIDLAYERARGLGVENVDFHVADVESADLPEGAFDVVLARWSLMAVKDKPRTLRSLAKTLRPGGRLVAGLWADPSQVPALALAQRTVYEHFDWPMENCVPQGAFSLADRDSTLELFAGAGYRDLSTVSCDVVYDFDSPASYIQYRLDVADSIWDEMAGMAEEDWQAAFRAIEDRLKPCLTSDGRCRIVSHAYCIAAQVGAH